MFLKVMFRKSFPALLFFGAMIICPIASARVPEVQLIVLPLKSETLRQCEQSSVSFLQANGFKTSVDWKGSEFVKIYGKKPYSNFSLQLECDSSLNTKALGFSHPHRSKQSSIDAIIEGLLY